ncbi:YlqD family protein [Halalkalibacter urbisdiaboli]|uniref:YlqD family protein n=1 Tax=Halalkalibacter urbisdiaboli TaxID=1960589 RepID=UPI000B4414D6|nr:YlqD family protein [Halalkalibacter urbisdiaboli]
MKLLRTVAVKHMLTEKKKANMLKEFEKDVIQVERELEQLKFQLHKAIRDVEGNEERRLLRERFNQEIALRQEKLAAVDFKIQQLQKLEIGTELNEGTVDAIVDVRVGDPWPDQSNEIEIIIKDGIIHEFREGRNET